MPGPRTSRWRRAAEFIADHEAGLLWIYGAPLLLASNLPFYLFLATLLPIPLFWLARRIARGAFSRRTPLDLPVALLLVAGAVGVLVSTDPQTSVRAYGELLGEIALAYGLINGLRADQVGMGAAGLLALSLALGLVGILGLEPQGKFSALLPLETFLPRLDFSWLKEGSFAPNLVAGAIAPAVPLAWAWLLARGQLRVSRVLLLLPALLLPVLLVLTKSRGAGIGVGAAILVLFVWRVPRLYRLILLGLLVLVPVLFAVGPERILEAVLSGDATGSAAGRLELWERAVYMVQDFPFTGIGLGTFSNIVVHLYPLLVNDPGAVIPHAHNLYLQTAVDYGLPGFTAMLGIWTVVLVVGVQNVRRLDRDERGPLAAGLLAGYLVYLVHGFTDNVTFSTKPGLIVWMIVGLVLAMRQAPPLTASAEQSGRAGVSELRAPAQTRNL